jgi:hypothetical protein
MATKTPLQKLRFEKTLFLDCLQDFTRKGDIEKATHCLRKIDETQNEIDWRTNAQKMARRRSR